MDNRLRYPFKKLDFSNFTYSCQYKLKCKLRMNLQVVTLVHATNAFPEYPGSHAH